MSIKTMTDSEFIEKHCRLVHYTIRKYFGNTFQDIEHKCNLDYEDLYQIGCMALLKARDCFDESKNIKFSTYAVSMIWGKIYREVRENRKLKISRSVLDARHKIFKEKLQDKSPEEISKELGISLNIAKDALHLIEDYASTNKPIRLDGSSKPICLEDILTSEDSSDTDYDLEDIENKEIINDFLSTLKHYERQVWELHLSQGLRQRTVGDLIGLSQAQVSRITKSILKKASEYGKRKGLQVIG